MLPQRTQRPLWLLVYSKTLIVDPCGLPACDHFFCQSCLEGYVDKNAKCPVCHQEVSQDQIEPNSRLKSLSM